jgi:hypothetical protein
MGYSIELYALNWDHLASVFGSGDKALLESILSRQGPKLFFRDSLEKTNWEQQLTDLLLGAAGRRLALDQPANAQVTEVSDAFALALTAIIRQRGEFIASLQHSSMAGSHFREDFLANSAARALGTSSELLLFLVDRPLFGLHHSGFPSWGGLQKTEIDTLLEKVTLSDLPPMGDSDDDAWLYDLCDALFYAKDSGRDIVSLYL